MFGDSGIIQDSLRLTGEILQETQQTVNSHGIWKWMAIVEFVIIVGLLCFSKIRQQDHLKRKLREESLKDTIDFDNIVGGIFLSKKLYNELKVKCHPDRFSPDKEKEIIADSIFQKITQNKTNVKVLLALKTEAEQKLKIDFETEL